MGYTHYMRTDNWEDEDKKRFSAAKKDIKDIFNRYNDIVCYEYDDENSQPLVNNDMIHFNGKNEDGHETFMFRNKQDQNGSNFCFCKTARKPYDIVVCEVLLVLKHHIPNITISSDGFYKNQETGRLDGTWDQAFKNVKKHYGYEFDVVEEVDYDKRYDIPVSVENIG